MMNNSSYKEDWAYSEYVKLAGQIGIGEHSQSELPKIKIFVLRNFTIEPLLPVIQGEILRMMLYPEVVVGDFATVMQTVCNTQSKLYSFAPDLIILAQWLESTSPALALKFPILSASEIEQESLRVFNELVSAVREVRKRTNVPLLLNTFPLPMFPPFGIREGVSSRSLTSTILMLNEKMQHELAKEPNVFIVDYSAVFARVGGLRAIDERLWHIAKNPLGLEVLVPLGRQYGAVVRALKAKTKKCLVLDCDNTLWGGIVGEDGIENIKLGSSYPGSFYTAFQQEVLNLQRQGVIIALCSKNNEADVWEVFHRHPDMLLREGHLVTWQINWQDKSENIKRIAADLNIGLDSIVFADDSQLECDLVKHQLPQVAVIELGQDPSLFVRRLRNSELFGAFTSSAEDAQRTQMYRAEAERKQILEKAGSIEDYLASLDMAVEIGLADQFSIGRISQLTQKTNQFNLTTIRYTESDIASIANGKQNMVFWVRLKDKVSDLGIVGAVILRFSDSLAQIDTFLLSCRALGRGAEEVMLAHAIGLARKRGCGSLVGRYAKTAKNSQVELFYQQRGFNCAGHENNITIWEADLESLKLDTPSWIRVIELGEENKSGGNQGTA